MSILKKLLGAIESSREFSGLAIQETPGKIVIYGEMSQGTLSAWQSVYEEDVDWLAMTCVDDIQDNIQPKDGTPGETFRIVLTFNTDRAAPHFVTTEGWRQFLRSEDQLASANHVRLAFLNATFATRAFSVEPWSGELLFSSPVREEKAPSKIAPRRFVRSHSVRAVAPVRLEPWMLTSSPVLGDSAYLIWQEIAGDMLIRSLPNELYEEEDVAKIVLSGQPPRKIDLGKFQPEDGLFVQLQEACQWVYFTAEDIEVRHTFMSAELARDWPEGKPFSDGLGARLPIALESAVLLYKAHLRSGSKDTLKALGDLRKTLTDEVQKLMQQSRDLSSAVWKDIGIAIGTLCAKLALDMGKSPELAERFAVVYLLVAGFIGISYFLTVRTNRNFLKVIDDSRQAWRGKLYAYLDDADYRALAENPVSNAVKAYQKAELFTTVVICGVVVSLIVSAAPETFMYLASQFLFVLTRIALPGSVEGYTGYF